MSIAGIRSNRGDDYQTLVAFDWALTVLYDPDYQWIEIDSITHLVDDIVVGKGDGGQIAIQCKKNQIDFKAWSITDLEDELDKASRLLNSNPNAEVRFYSRNNFGALAKLREHSSTQNDELAYKSSLGKEQKLIDSALGHVINVPSPDLSTFTFLCRTKFVTSEELDRMEELLRERLRNIVSNCDPAFNAIWARLDRLGARIDGNGISTSVRHRLTKEDLNSIVHRSGAILAPPMDLAEVRSAFLSTSAIGRAWRRDIVGHRITSSTLDEILLAITSKKKSILLTGLPGSGKTCVLLELQDELESRMASGSNVVPLYIQSREFADLSTSEDRKANGLSDHWVEKVARLAVYTYVVIVIDSLDVLSIARDHRVINYFLAQIDRLLLLENITVVVACRDFDRHYDRRIAERNWEFEIACQPLQWDSEITPILNRLGIETKSIDSVTRELIKNPRELALFVALAQHGGSFNAVTSQALAQKYLDVIVRSNQSLGDEAIKVIEGIAFEMLNSRTLTVSPQRFSASQAVRRALCSLNILLESSDGKLSFGHQTLLDVLVISGAIRKGQTLHNFIAELPPVPFVRPSIRSFVAQLQLGDRREFRKQLRTVFTSKAAFHIRRLVAESFAEQTPLDDDWPLIRDLRAKHRELFNVVYGAGKNIEWHRFWLKHLVPFMKAAHDIDGIVSHVHHVARWSNDDSTGVFLFWNEAISLPWLSADGLADRISIHLSDVKPENMLSAAPLLYRIFDLPRSDHNLLGRVIANSINAGIIDDVLLWRHITGDVTDTDILGYEFGSKLRCSLHEFGDRSSEFILNQMKKSTILLDLSLDSIERWSDSRKSRYGRKHPRFRHGFLSTTSFDKAHSQRDIRHIEGANILLDAVEYAICHHAEINSEWWQKNAERLCFNLEGALLYFAVLACTASPNSNVDLICRMLCTQEILEFELRYELGTLINSSFSALSIKAQDAVTTSILAMYGGDEVDENRRFWILKIKAELLSTIPCYLRSPDAQSLIDTYECRAGALIRQPDTTSRGGMVGAPFSFEIFLRASDTGILRLLRHYEGYSDWHDLGSDFLNGGEREVGGQLREAASRNPSRFVKLLSKYRASICETFRGDILDGVSAYLSYRHGNLQSDHNWSAIEHPTASSLAAEIIDELEKRTIDWRKHRSAAKALEAVANVTNSTEQAARVVFLALGFEGIIEPNSISGEGVDLLSIGINLIGGDVAEALMILAINLLEAEVDFPELLRPTLCQFARSENPAIRALILRRLPYLQTKMLEFGWKLFSLAMLDSRGIWKISEPCLYYSYSKNFGLVSPLLERILNEGDQEDLESWGRISALAVMTKNIELTDFLTDLRSLNKISAWHGAATVWTNPENMRLHQHECVTGIENALFFTQDVAEMVANEMENIFREKNIYISMPIALIQRCFAIFESDLANKRNRLFGFHEWLNASSQIDPEFALSAAEIYIQYIRQSKPYFYDHNNNLTQCMTRLFAEAEEQEECDNGTMLRRVVNIQDDLLSLGLNGVIDWLTAAERP